MAKNVKTGEEKRGGERRKGKEENRNR